MPTLPLAGPWEGFLMTAAKRPPYRQKKADRLLTPGSDRSPEAIRCDYAVAPVDQRARQMDKKWGVDRLPELVSPVTAQKFGSALARLNAALDATDPDEALARAAVVIRGLDAMDAEAEAAGAPQASPHVIQAEVDGWRFGILTDAAFWPAAQEAHPGLTLFSLREIAVAMRTMQMHHPMIEEAKKIGGAEIIAIKPKLDAAFWDDGGDDIPL